MPDDFSAKRNSPTIAGCESARTGIAIMLLGLGAMYFFMYSSKT